MSDIKSMPLAALLDSDRIFLSRGLRQFSLGAASVCLDHNRHAQGVLLAVDGFRVERYSVHWASASEEDNRTYADLHEAVQFGAYAIAFLILIHLTEHTVIERAAKNGGFDFWLGNAGDLGLQRKARLEISGILSNPSELPGRVRRKETQTKRSDSTLLPAYVAVVEFETPKALVTRR